MTGRRQFIGLGVLGAAAVGAHRLLGRSPLPEVAVDESGAPWDWLRQQFDFAAATRPRIPMNAANLTPSLRPVRETVLEAARRLDLDASFHHRKLFRHLELEPTRVLLARLVGARSPGEIAFVRNTTEANAAVINGLPLAAGDEVLLWTENHHSNQRSWGYRASRDGFRCRPLRLPSVPASGGQLVDAVLAQLTPATRVLSFSAVSNISGLRLPVAELCAAAHAAHPDLYIHVDGAQAWGSQALDLAAAGCDSFSGSAHKWLMGPREIGMLYVRGDWALRMLPATIGYDYAIEYPETGLADTAARFECLGQRNDALLPGLRLALELQQRIGPARIEARIGELAGRLAEGLRELGLELITPADPALRHGIIVVDVGGTAQAVRAFRALYEVHGIYAAFVHRNQVLADPEQLNAAAGPSFLRLSPSVYNSEQDIDRLLAALRELLRGT